MSLTTVYYARECGDFPYTKCIVPIAAKDWFLENGAFETEAEATEELLGPVPEPDEDEDEDELQGVGEAESNDLGGLSGRLNEFKKLAGKYLGAHND